MIDSVENGTDRAGWLTIAKAAERSGLSPDAIRRRIKRGQLPAKKIETPFGMTWMVSVQSGEGGATPSSAPPSPLGATPPPAQPSLPGDVVLPPVVTEFLEHLRRLEDELQRRDAALLARTEAAAAWQGRAEVLEAELAKTREQLALMAPKVEPEPSRPWWRRLWA